MLHYHGSFLHNAIIEVAGTIIGTLSIDYLVLSELRELNEKTI